MNKKRIFKKSLAIELMENGCNLIKIEENNRNNRLKVYVFEDDRNLRRVLDELYPNR